MFGPKMEQFIPQSLCLACEKERLRAFCVCTASNTWEMAVAQCYKSVGTVFLVNDLKSRSIYLRVCLGHSVPKFIGVKRKSKSNSKMLKTKHFFLVEWRKKCVFFGIFLFLRFFLCSACGCCCNGGKKQDENITLNIHKQTPANRIHV